MSVGVAADLFADAAALGVVVVVDDDVVCPGHFYKAVLGIPEEGGVSSGNGQGSVGEVAIGIVGGNREGDAVGLGVLVEGVGGIADLGPAGVSRHPGADVVAVSDGVEFVEAVAGVGGVVVAVVGGFKLASIVMVPFPSHRVGGDGSGRVLIVHDGADVGALAEIVHGVVEGAGHGWGSKGDGVFLGVENVAAAFPGVGDGVGRAGDGADEAGAVGLVSVGEVGSTCGGMGGGVEGGLMPDFAQATGGVIVIGGGVFSGDF